MWRGYGQNGDGISLGFDFSKLPSTLPMYGADCKERKYWSESKGDKTKRIKVEGEKNRGKR